MNVQIPSAFRFLWSTKADDGGAVRYRTAWGGRGSAKSHSFAQALVLKGAQSPLRIGCFREVQLTLKESVKYQIPAGTQTGSTYRLREQGIQRLNASGKGDLLVTVTVEVPKHLTDEQRQLLEQLAESYGEGAEGRPGKRGFGRNGAKK